MTEPPKSPPGLAKDPVREPIVFVIDDDISMRRALTNLFQSVGLEVDAFFRNDKGGATFQFVLPVREEDTA